MCRQELCARNTMSEKSNISCWDCSYFEDELNNCSFLDKPTTKDTKCFAELYKLVDLCGDNECESCQYLLKGCKGDRKNPPKKLQVHPHEGQMKLSNSTAQYVAALAGAQSGKTRYMPVVIHKEMLKMGSGDALCVSSSYPLMDKTLIPIYKTYFVDYLHIGKWFEQKKKLEIKSGEDFDYTIFFTSADNPESLESVTAKVAHLDEAGQDKFTLEAYEAVLRRVSGNNGRIFFTTTLYNFGWLKSEVYDRWMQGDTDYEIIQWPSNIRPGYSKTVWDDRKRKMQRWKFDMQMCGIYSRPAGMVYSDFDESVHLVKPFKIPARWDWHVGIDPGGVHSALVWLAEEPGTNIFYLVHSYLAGNKTTPEHVKDTMNHSKYSRVVDWRGGNRTNEEQFRLDWKAAGIPVQEPPIRNVEAMIDRVTILLKENRLLIFNNEQNTTSSKEEKSILDEFRSFSRVLDETGRVTDKLKDEKLYHKLAALRYFASKTTTGGDYSTPYFEQKRTVPIFANKGSMNVIGKRKEPPRW